MAYRIQTIRPTHMTTMIVNPSHISFHLPSLGKGPLAYPDSYYGSTLAVYLVPSLPSLSSWGKTKPPVKHITTTRSQCQNLLLPVDPLS
jgi:hypothetical protein